MRLTGLRVLVAEDNPLNRRLLVQMLKKFDLNPDLAPDGAAAAEMAIRHHYNLILMDCMMPVMDGFEATARIRAALSAPEGGDSLPIRPVIIAITANAFHEDRGRCLAAGMDDYLSKPFTFDQLRSILQRWAPIILGSQPLLTRSPPGPPATETPSEVRS
jgi:CheY-like chemotaxis protein